MPRATIIHSVSYFSHSLEHRRGRDEPLSHPFTKLLQSLQCGLTPRFLSFKLSDLTIAMLPMLLTLQSAMWVMAPTVLNSSTIYTQGHYRNYQTLSRMQAVRSAYLTPCASDKSFLPKLPISCMRRAKGMHRAQQ